MNGSEEGRRKDRDGRRRWLSGRLLGAAALLLAAGTHPLVAAGWETARSLPASVPGFQVADAGAVVVNVLPFEAAAGSDPALAVGLAEVLAEGIARLPGVVVRGPGEAGALIPAFRGPIGELGAVLRGTVTEREGGVRVDLRLERGERGSDGPELGVEIPEGRLPELPTLLTREVASALGRSVPPSGEGSPSGARAPDPGSFRSFLRGRGLEAAAEGGPGQRIALLREVVREAPGFGPALAALAQAYMDRDGAGEEGGPGDLERAEALFRRALELEPHLPSAAWGLGTLYARTGRQEETAELLEGAIAAHPHHPALHSRMGYILRYAGLLDACVAFYRRSLVLDDGPPNRVSDEGQIAKALVYRGDYAEALALQQGLGAQLDRIGGPVDEKILFYEGIMHLYAGDHESAVRLFDAALEADPGSLWSAFGKAYTHGIRGDTVRLVELARELEGRDVADGERHYRLVHFYAMAGRHEAALARLRTALEGGFFSYPYIRSDPLTASLRETPGFAEVLEEIRARHEAFRARFGSLERLVETVEDPAR